MAVYKASVRVIEAVRKALAEDRLFALGGLMASEIDLRGASTADLKLIAELVGTSLRTIQYAMKVYRFAIRVGLSEAEVGRIGWTKVAVVTSGSDDRLTKNDVMAMCEGRTVAEVRAAVAGTVGSIKVVAFNLNNSQRRELEAALTRHGAVRVGRGLVGKEAALMKMISKST